MHVVRFKRYYESSFLVDLTLQDGTVMFFIIDLHYRLLSLKSAEQNIIPVTLTVSHSL